MRRCNKCKFTDLEKDFGSRKTICKECLRKKYKEQNSKKCVFCGESYVRRSSYCSIKCTLQGKIKINQTGCWIWQAARDKDGYGVIKQEKGNKQLKTHRVSFEIFKGNIPNGLFVLHICDEPSCCNPDHLWIGDAKENSEDCINKNRRKNDKGSKNPMSKLNEKFVGELKKKFLNGERTTDLSRKHKIPYKTLEKIRQNITWRHVILQE